MDYEIKRFGDTHPDVNSVFQDKWYVVGPYSYLWQDGLWHMLCCGKDGSGYFDSREEAETCVAKSALMGWPRAGD